MPNTDAAFIKYIQTINAALRSGSTTEHTHRAALEELINSFETGLTVINEPGRIGESAPDLLIRKGEAILGYVETKDVGFDLAKWKRSDQCKRYLSQFDNLIFTNYIDFQWFVDGNPEPVETRRLGEFDGSKVSSNLEGREYIKTLLANFLERKPTKVGRVDDLARRMAAKAKAISEMLHQELIDKGSKSPLFSQLQAFRKTLIADLEESAFADMYAQTLAYGLFAARDQHRHEHMAGDFTLVRATSFIPKSNPFLRQLFRMESGELMEMKNVAWMIEDLVRLLRYCDIGLIMEDFGKKMGRHDPVIDLYETFLKHYDPKMREMRGVYYTPEPVVSYIVRSIDELLINEFGKKQGLADPEVMILDPAVGTGTFLFHTIKLIHKRVKETMGEGAWDSYVRENLIPRLFGFELLMAPYTICHLKLGLLLQELGYKFRDDDRLRIYLTNALEPGIPFLKRDETELLFASEIVKEAKDAAEVKTEKPIWVVMGNPPYSGHSANKGKWISDLLKGKDVDIEGVPPRSYYDVEGKPLNEKNPKWLQDDYVKFLRFAQWRIEKTGHGIVGMITNHGWLDNPTFRGMREKLIKAFDRIYVLDLHGNSKKKEKAPDGSPDENVFDIQQGVAISLFLKRAATNDKRILKADLWGLSGKRESEPEPSTKLFYLVNNSVSNTSWESVYPKSSLFLLSQVDTLISEEVEGAIPLNEIFIMSALGFVTSRDYFVLDYEATVLQKRIDTFYNMNETNEAIRAQFRLSDTRDWKLDEARKKVRHKFSWKEVLTECLYRPFDKRFVYYGNSLIEMPRPNLMRQMIGTNNLALLTTRMTKDQFSAYVTDSIAEHKSASRYDGTYIFPLYTYELQDEEPPSVRTSNLSKSFLSLFESKLNTLSNSLEPRSVFNYIYAMLHSPSYRSRYAEFLKIEFPRIPLTSDYELFLKLSELGGELVKVHLLKHGMLSESKVRIVGKGDNGVEGVRYNDITERVHINAMQYFTNVQRKHWEFMIGGYPVLYKWLKEREKAKRRLDLKDIQHFQKMVAAVDMTISLMAEIDRAIPKWPIE